MKNFLKTTKGIFVTVTIGLWVLILGLVFANIISLTAYIGSMAGIAGAMFGLYNWYIKEEVIEQRDNLKFKLKILEDEKTQSYESAKEINKPKRKYTRKTK